MLVLAIDDAKIIALERHVHDASGLLLVGFQHDHNLTLQIWYDLGFPTDAIQIVKDMYTDATTSYKTAHGKTGPVPVDRGTLQGDTLPPFLFIMYIEPLL
jgi:hypothetical protein